MPTFSLNITEKLYNSIVANKKRILEYLRKKEIIGKNPQGETTRFFDKAIELALIKSLQENNYKGTIIGEETGVHEGVSGNYIFIDPLDGSLNAARGINYYCVALAHSKSPKLEDFDSAVVWDVPNDVIYFAEKNHGAYKIVGNEIVRIRIPEFSDTIVIDVGFTVCEECLKRIKSMGTFRRLGSIIMSSLLVTEGVLDGVFDTGNLKATDALAPYVIVAEAGGYTFINKTIFQRNERVHLIVARSADLFEILMDIYDKYVARKKQ